MKVAFKESFLKDLERARDATVRRRVREIIEQVEAAETFITESGQEITGLD